MRRNARIATIERCAVLADIRAVVCREAAAGYADRGEDQMAATERCAAREAEHIAGAIRALAD